MRTNTTSLNLQNYMYYFKYFLFAGSANTVNLCLLLLCIVFQKNCFQMKSKQIDVKYQYYVMFYITLLHNSLFAIQRPVYIPCNLHFD